jgi:hypothetical protein
MLIPPIRDPTQERDNVFLDFLNFSFSKKVGAGGFGTPCGVRQDRSPSTPENRLRESTPANFRVARRSGTNAKVSGMTRSLSSPTSRPSGINRGEQ